MHNTYAVLYTQGPLASTANVSADEGITLFTPHISGHNNFPHRAVSFIRHLLGTADRIFTGVQQSFI
jgi:hypothetical protein